MAPEDDAKVLARRGRKGGKASAAALTEDQRRERAKHAIAARWARKKTIPLDQAAVLARLVDGAPVVLRIAPGAGGARRRAAIEALASKGLIRIIEIGSDAITVARPTV
jgi:hypothetical protein